MRKLLSKNLRRHAGQFSEITIPHFLFAGGRNGFGFIGRKAVIATGDNM
jgi:hypothetical protein